MQEIQQPKYVNRLRAWFYPFYGLDMIIVFLVLLVALRLAALYLPLIVHLSRSTQAGLLIGGQIGGVIGIWHVYTLNSIATLTRRDGNPALAGEARALAKRLNWSAVATQEPGVEIYRPKFTGWRVYLFNFQHYYLKLTVNDVSGVTIESPMVFLKVLFRRCRRLGVTSPTM